MGRWMYEGSEEMVWARIEELSGQDLTTATIKVQHRSDRLKPLDTDPDWETPATGDVEHVGSVIRVGKLVTGAKVAGAPTKWWVWVLIDDNPELVIERAGYYTVL